MAYYPEFARILNQELQRQDRSASWLAHRLGVSPSTVTRWLNHGSRPGSPEAVTRIADVLGITARREELLVAVGFGFWPAAEKQIGEAHRELNDAMPSGAHIPAARLPQPPTPLVGRNAEIATLCDWLADPSMRLVTIVGPGGMGKTRLALAVGEAQLARGSYEHGVAFANLAPLTEADQIPGEIADAIDLPLESEGNHARSPDIQIIDFLRSRNLLLIIDNAEHLPGGEKLIAAITRGVSRVQILVTSRTALSLQEEQLFPLQGLDYAVSTRDTSLTETAAVTLFLQAAQRIRPEIGDTLAERREVASVCELVEGMPLAIELAAPWITVMTAGDILTEIRRSLEILETDSPTIPERHRSMEAVFDATWQRLDIKEKRVFSRISVFRGGFTRDAAATIAGAELGELRKLAAKSLIVHDRGRDRYTIHELLRQYGAMRLSELPRLEDETAGAHSAFYIDLLHQRQNALKNRGLQTDLQVLDAEIDNLTHAWQWAAAHDRVEDIVATMDGLGIYLQWRGRSEEGVAAFRLAAAAQERSGQHRHLARALAWQALFTRILGENDYAVALLQRCRRILDDRSLNGTKAGAERAFVLLQMGAATAGQDAEAAKGLYQESLDRYVTLGDAWFIAEALLGLAYTSLIQGDFDSQRSYVQDALDTYRQLGNVRGTAAALSMLADIDSYQGRLMSGLELGLESLAAFRSLGDRVGTATALSRLGMTYINLGDVTNARQVVSESAKLFADMGSRRDEVFAHALLCAAKLVAGNYDAALVSAERSLQIGTELEDQFMLGVAYGWEGWARIYTGDLAGALQSLREAVAITRHANATMDLTRALALLGYAQWKNGQQVQTRAHCAESLHLAAQVADTWSLASSLSTATAVLARGNPERSLELHSMLMQEPLCAASRWYQDGVGIHVEAAKSSLPDRIAESAIERGKTLDPVEEAAKLGEKGVG